MNTDELKFDTMAVDTKLAEEYLQLHTEMQNLNTGKEYAVPLMKIDNLCEKLTHLSKLIVENKQLFCQLEYLIRNVPIKETEEYDLKLLVNNLLYSCEYAVKTVPRDPVIKMKEDTPCAMLGWIAQIYIASEFCPILEASEKTVAICHLFSQLCVKAGFPEVPVQLYSCKLPESETRLTLKVENIKELEYGCVGIITNCSDIDSAVNVILEAPRRKPWAVREIFIEESAVEGFKRAISWKTRDNEPVGANIASQCTASYIYNGRPFLLEYVGSEREDAVLVNTYRTAKELLTLVPQCLAASLWASDVAQANELALNIKSNVWINCFGNFSGPVQTSQAFFSLCRPTAHTELTDKIQSLKTMQIGWARRNVLDRTATVRECLSIGCKPDLDELFHVSDAFMCCGAAAPVGLVALLGPSVIEHTVKNLIVGNAVLVNSPSKLEKEQICKLREAGAPASCEPFEFTAGGCRVGFGEFYRKKIIWTTYGTIFAN